MSLRVFVMRHAERADEAGEPWPDQATAPYNPPLSTKGREQARAAGAALAAASTVTHIAVSPFLRCLQTAAGVLEGLGGSSSGATAQVEVDPALCEILGPPFLPPGTVPWAVEGGGGGGGGGGGDDDADAWVWAGGSYASALQAAGLPPTTPLAPATPAAPWPHLCRPLLPERLEAGHARYDAAIAAAATRAVTPKAPSRAATALLLVTHGEGVRRAVTRVAPGACVYEVQHCGWAACEWVRGDGDGGGGDGGGGGGDPGEWALLQGESSGVAWL